MPWSNPSRTPVPHNLQRGCGRRHPQLGDSDGGNIGGNGGTWTINMGLGGVLLYQQWTRHLDPNGEAAEGV